jgi:hypothetical protein
MMQQYVKYPLRVGEDTRVYRYFIGKNGQSLRSMENMLDCRLEIRELAKDPCIKVYPRSVHYMIIKDALDKTFENCRRYVREQWNNNSPKHIMETMEIDRGKTISPSVSSVEIEDVVVCEECKECKKLTETVKMLESRLLYLESTLDDHIRKHNMPPSMPPMPPMPPMTFMNSMTPSMHQSQMNKSALFMPFGYHESDWM